MYGEEIFVWFRREFIQGTFRITTTIVLTFFMTFLIIILGMFLHNHVKKLKLRDEDIYFPQLNIVTSFHQPLPLPVDTNPVCNHSLPSLNVNLLSNWISPETIWHSMSEDELMWRASMVPRIAEYPYNRTPKVAFMFLTRGKLPLAPIWELFFKGHEGLFSIYLHTSPEFTYEPPESSAFHKRRIPSSKVEWGRASMIDAERRLLANALLDFSNERFVLLSESCIPIFNFTMIYNYLMNANQSFLSSFDDPGRDGRGRYNKRMYPSINLSDWRKGSQWFEVNRKLAIEIVSESTYYHIFKNHCMPPCYMDEHYIPTLVTKFFPDLASNRSITWVDWSRRASHPATFFKKHISPKFLNEIRFGYNCSYNGENTSICFMFARKFHPSSLQPLLSILPNLLGFSRSKLV